MKDLLLVGAGGFLGSVLRFKTGAWSLHHYQLMHPHWPTFAVNVTGCLLVGVVATLLEHVEFYNAEMRLLLITGFLGGFTTFSAFGLETVSLFRSGQIFLAVVNVVGSIILGLLAVWFGMKMGRFAAGW